MSLKIKLPAILLAHNLFSGKPEYWHARGWTASFDGALIIQNAQELEAIEKIIQAELAKNQVCDCEFIEIEFDENAKPNPRHFRDRILIFGPTLSIAGHE